MKRKYFRIFVVLTIVALAYGYIIRDFPQADSTLYINGTIITMEESLPQAQAMLVENGLITAIGSNDELAKPKTSTSKVVDLHGAVVMPGFIDPHTHVALSAFLENMIDLSGFKHKSNQEVWDYLAKNIKTHQPGDWIVGKGIDPVLVKDLVTPDLAFLDKIAPDNPLVLISQSLHTYWANSMAFSLAGIDKTTANPSKASFYEKDSLGNLTGLIAEQLAFMPILDVLKKEVFTPQALIESTTKVLHNYAKNGNTTVVSAGITINDARPLRLYEHLSANKATFINQLLATLGVLPARAPYPRHFIYIRFDKAFLLPKKKTDDDFYAIIGIKHWYDGSPYTGSMYLREPYLTSTLTTEGLHIPVGYRGKALLSKDDLAAFIKSYDSLGWQVAIHVQGDIGNEEVIEAYEQVNKQQDISKARHRIEHCLLLADTSMHRLKEIGLTPSFHVNHLYYYGQALKKSILGKDRTNKMLAVASARDNGIKYSFHADQPMFESKPFRLIQTAVERQTIEGDTIGYQQRVRVMDGLKAMTINAAWQIHKENKIGSLKKGKYADFIILDKNPLAIPVGELDKINVLQTYVNGNAVN